MVPMERAAAVATTLTTTLFKSQRPKRVSESSRR